MNCLFALPCLWSFLCFLCSLLFFILSSKADRVISPPMIPFSFSRRRWVPSPWRWRLSRRPSTLASVPANKPLVHVFRLKNTGAVPLTITEVTGVCGVSVREVGRKVLKAGEATDLTLGINLLTQPEGPNCWKLAVRYKRRQRSRRRPAPRVVAVAAKVKKDVTVEPVAMMLSAEREITGALTVLDRRGKPLTVTGVRLGLKDVNTRVKPATDADGKRTQKIELTVTDACPPASTRTRCASTPTTRTTRNCAFRCGS